jgi:beta-aspartyl-peptidase (threonine type)
LDAAVTAGHRQLQAGDDGLDVVVSIIQRMEESPLFNAGKGSVYTWEGRHELDASIMHGDRLDAGAVAGVTTVQSPIALARAVMERSPHVMLTAKGAESFAREQGFPVTAPSYFETERRKKALDNYKRSRRAGRDVDVDYKFGTVGVVVLDRQGNLVAGTSTGGMTGKRWGPGRRRTNHWRRDLCRQPLLRSLCHGSRRIFYSAHCVARHMRAHAICPANSG